MFSGFVVVRADAADHHGCRYPIARGWVVRETRHGGGVVLFLGLAETDGLIVSVLYGAATFLGRCGRRTVWISTGQAPQSTVMASQSRPPARLLAHQDAFAILCALGRATAENPEFVEKWRAGTG